LGQSKDVSNSSELEIIALQEQLASAHKTLNQRASEFEMDMDSAHDALRGHTSFVQQSMDIQIDLEELATALESCLGAALTQARSTGSELQLCSADLARVKIDFEAQLIQRQNDLMQANKELEAVQEDLKQALVVNKSSELEKQALVEAHDRTMSAMTAAHTEAMSALESEVLATQDMLETTAVECKTKLDKIEAAAQKMLKQHKQQSSDAIQKLLKEQSDLAERNQSLSSEQQRLSAALDRASKQIQAAQSQTQVYRKLYEDKQVTGIGTEVPTEPIEISQSAMRSIEFVGGGLVERVPERDVGTRLENSKLLHTLVQTDGTKSGTHRALDWLGLPDNSVETLCLKTMMKDSPNVHENQQSARTDAAAIDVPALSLLQKESLLKQKQRERDLEMKNVWLQQEKQDLEKENNILKKQVSELSMAVKQGVSARRHLSEALQARNPDDVFKLV